MAGTAVVPNFKHIFQNPVFIFWNCGLPANGARLTIDSATGTPDSVGSPNARWIGTTKEGATFSANVETENVEVDEYEGPVDQRIIRGTATFEGELMEVLDFKTYQMFLPGTQFTEVIAGPAAKGIEQISGGGIITLAPAPVVGISESPEHPLHWIVLQLYKAQNTGGIKLQMSSRNRASSPFKFEGQDVVGRPRGDRNWTLWKETPIAP